MDFKQTKDLIFAVNQYARMIARCELSFDRSIAHKKICDILGIDAWTWRPFEKYKKSKYPNERECQKIIWDTLREYEPPSPPKVGKLITLCRGITNGTD